MRKIGLAMGFLLILRIHSFNSLVYHFLIFINICLARKLKTFFSDICGSSTKLYRHKSH